MTPAQQLELGRTYLRSLRRTHLRIDRLSGRLIGPHGLTSPQFLALLLIRDNEGWTQVELTTELDSDQNTVSALVRRLASRGLITREPHPSDRRAMQLKITEVGRSLVEETLPDVDRLSRKLAVLMPSEHEDIIVEWLRRVADVEDLG